MLVTIATSGWSCRNDQSYSSASFVLHRGRVALLDASVVPSGQVLTREGRLVPLPADFSGFILDRTGNSQPMIVDKGSEAFTKQARVPQVQEVVSLPPRSVPRGSGAAPAPVPNGPNGVVVNLNGATGALLPSPAETGANSNTTDDNVDGTVVNQLVLDQSRFTPASPKGVLAKQARANFTTNVEEVNPVSTTSDRVITPAGNGSNQITAPLPAGSSTARTAGGVPATSGAGTTGRSGRDGAH